MKLFVDVTRLKFSVSKLPVEKTDQNGKQKTDRNTHELLWSTKVMAHDGEDGEIITITTAGPQAPKVTVFQEVVPVELEAIPWATNGKSGTAFKAVSITVAGAAGSKPHAA
jgi:hypothetical protein